ncbi:hypothetical protein FHT09_001245 [Xanthomonas arboricola]|uniref:hypothetical protein n=1 Tax=Xanthomonas TaxID=338 RepID=UPI000CEDA8EB|nr:MULTISPECIES: hypothetical protein [Xanthomonas]MBB5735546.1 hypothetical protein [Xanthomonas sp. CFBP 8152]PPT78542.1 hypothetical protein XarbCFBP8152_11535 [Xanthomonas arboricola]
MSDNSEYLEELVNLTAKIGSLQLARAKILAALEYSYQPNLLKILEPLDETIQLLDKKADAAELAAKLAEATKTPITGRKPPRRM